MKLKKVDPFFVPVKARRPILMRMVFGYINNGLLYASLKLLSMSKATLLIWTQPMFVGVMSYFVLGERFTRFDTLGLILVFLGVVLLANPFQPDPSQKEYPH